VDEFCDKTFPTAAQALVDQNNSAKPSASTNAELQFGGWESVREVTKR
jgi:hypothetical protein